MAEPRSGAKFFSGRGIELAVGCLPVVVVLAHLDLPLQEDALFWWVPQALEIAERGPRWGPSGDLPLACSPTEALPAQWRSGLPDYGHPPLWFHYLAAFLALIPNALAAVHWASVPVAAVFGMGVVRLSRQLTGSGDGPIVACVILAVPAIGVQWLRPDTDLGLLVGVVWTLAYVAEGRHLAAAGVAALAGLLAACADDSARTSLGLTDDSRVLVIGSEGATDPQLYQRIVGRSPDEVGGGS